MFRNSVFLSSGDRDLGVAFKIHPGSHVSFQVEAKNSALLSRYARYLLEPIYWPKGSQASCGFLRGDSGLFSRPCRKRRASSNNDGRITWILLRCGTTCGVSLELRIENQEPLVWPQGSPVSIGVPRESVALLWSHSRGIRPQDT